MTETGRRLDIMDDGVFEQLVIRYVADTYPELRGIAVTGMNDEGKPVACPVDGMFFLPEPAPTCVFVASTTMARKALRGKWLNSASKGAKAGDVVKSVSEFAKWQAKIKDVQKRLFLATNRMLGGDAELYLDAVAAAENAGIHIEVIEASAFLRYLDDTARGQMARQDLLGINANRISLSLLQKLSDQSLLLHWNRYVSGRTTNNSLIERTAMPILRRALETPGMPVAVVGPSGYGKTILVHQVGREWLTKKRVAFWIAADNIVLDAPITATLSQVLHNLHPSLMPSAAEDTLCLIAEKASPMLLLVDDVNRSGNRERILQTIRGWNARISENFETRLPSEVRVLFPLWDEAALQSAEECRNQSARGNDFKALPSTDSWRFISVGAYSTEERTLLEEKRIENGMLRKTDSLNSRRITDILGGDPFLCGLVPPDFVADASVGQADVLRKLFDTVVDESCQKAVERARRAGIRTTASELGTAFDGLCDIVLDDDTPEPTVQLMRSRLGERAADLLHHLADGHELGWIDDQPKKAHWRWKHNRLRDALLGRRLATRVFQQWPDSTLSASDVELLKHPGLAEAWALSLSFAPGTADQVHLIKQLASDNPLALAHTLRLSLFPSEKSQRNALCSGLKALLNPVPDREGEYVHGIETLVLEQLGLTDDPLVLDVLESSSLAWDVNFSRVRNGDIDTAIRIIDKRTKQSGFVPGMGFGQLERALVGCGKFYSGDPETKMRFISRMESLLQNDSQTNAILAMLGYIAWPEFAGLIGASWERWRHLWENTSPGEDHDGYTKWLHHLWSLGRCCTPETEAVLEELLSGVARIPDTSNNHGGTVRHDLFGRSMGRASGLRLPITDPAARVWAKVAVENEAINWDLFYACRHLEHPEIVEAYVRWSAVAKPELWSEFTGSWDVLSDPQPSVADRYGETVVFQNEKVLERLWNLVKNETSHDLRRLAFVVWKRAAGLDDLSKLQSIDENDSIFDDALAVRVRLGDESAVPALARKINDKPREWCGYAPRFYSDPAIKQAFLNNYADAIVIGYESLAAPKHIPKECIPELIDAHREALLKQRKTWIPLLLTDVPEAISLVRTAIEAASEKDMKYLFWENLHNDYSFTRRMLDALVPVLHKIEEGDIEHFVEYVIRAGHAEWAIEYLPEHVFIDERHRWLTEKDVISSLEILAENLPKSAFDARFEVGYHEAVENEIYDPVIKNRRLILRDWIGKNPTGNMIVVAAMVMAEQGTPDDLGWWNGLPIQDESARITWENAKRLLQIRRWQA